jgi:hypothetical protein
VTALIDRDSEVRLRSAQMLLRHPGAAQPADLLAAYARSGRA